MNDDSSQDFNDQMRERRNALEEIRKLGFDTYPHTFNRTHTISDIVAE